MNRMPSATHTCDILKYKNMYEDGCYVELYILGHSVAIYSIISRELFHALDQSCQKLGQLLHALDQLLNAIS
jgi:hypothetical protein